MACTSPLTAWRTPSGEVVLREPHPRPDGTLRLYLPCSGCVGCRLAQARSWAIRCTLELQKHSSACWVTLTYADAHLPPTLHKRHLQGWLKRVRKHFRDIDNRDRKARRIKVKDYKYRTIRFFGCGEYGEQNGRPHYHAIMFGVSRREASPLVEKWPFGIVQVDELSPASIAYVCGYVLKKSGPRDKLLLGPRVAYDYSGPATQNTFLDHSTGEEYRLSILHEPEFTQMSRRPGIGAHARAHVRSWRDSAIWGGKPVAVPRYLHKAWKDQATPEQLFTLLMEQHERQPKSLEELEEKVRQQTAQRIINHAKKKQSLSRRKL